MSGRREQRRKENERLRKEDLLSIVSTPGGRRFLWDMVYRRCELREVGPVGADGLLLTGKRLVGGELLRDIRAWAPKHFAQLESEGALAIVNDDQQRSEESNQKEAENE